MKLFQVVLAVTLLIIVYFFRPGVLGINIKDIPNTDREGRFVLLSLKPDPCRVNNVNGTCYTASSCTKRGGTSIGQCGVGNVGTCCKFEFGCSNSSTYRTVNETEVTIKDSRTCTYEFPKRDAFCQLKIEMKNVYTDPTIEGRCAAGSLTLRGSQTVTDFPFCGKNTRPFYLTYGDDSIISLSFENEEGESSEYEVKVTQIRCDSRERVPDHCLQQYEGSTGKITSFGYEKGYINNQQYTVCIKTRKANIEWKKCDDRRDPTTGLPELNTYKNFCISKPLYPLAVFGDECEKGSFVALSGAKYCGTIFEPTKSTVKPFTLTTKFVTDNIANYPMMLYHYSLGADINPRCNTAETDGSCWKSANAPAALPAIMRPLCLATCTLPPADGLSNVDTVSPGYCLEYTLT